MALLRAGGEDIRREARKHVPLKVGDVAVTSAGDLSAKYIFHAVTIDYGNLIYPTEDSVCAAVLKCLQLADTLKARLIAFPALGTGVGGFPFRMAAEVMTSTVADYLMGNTEIELVTLTLFARESVTNEDLNVFYEHAVALASISAQSKRLSALLLELRQIVDRMSLPQLSRKISELMTELTLAQENLSDNRSNLNEKEPLQGGSKISDICHDVVKISDAAIKSLDYNKKQSLDWDEKQLEDKVLRTKALGLQAMLNIQTSNLNNLSIEKAKYGGVGVPPRLEIAISEIKKEICETENAVSELRLKRIQLMHK